MKNELKEYLRERVNFLIITILLFATAWIAYDIGNGTNEDLFFQAVGKLESDSDYCFNAKEIKAIQETKITEEYKNYLFESDMRKRQAINHANQNPSRYFPNNYKNCEY